MGKNKEDTKAKFIYTVSRESAEILQQNGFTSVFEGGGFWVFMNENKNFNFDKINHITFSNMFYG